MIWKLEFWKLNFKIGVLKIKFESWKFENYLKMKALKIKFENWSFED